MCVKPNLGDKVVPVRCQPKTYPCPTCGRRGHRKLMNDSYNARPATVRIPDPL